LLVSGLGLVLTALMNPSGIVGTRRAKQEARPAGRLRMTARGPRRVALPPSPMAPKVSDAR
ncbi:MAG TPA: hypothetical protein VK507_00575, partial [Iamia sp.]|nr:hypothetical protein [Iamia sp.]